MLETDTFYTLIQELHETSRPTVRRQKLDMLITEYDEDSWEAAIHLLTGEYFSDNGVAVTKVKNVLEDHFGIERETINELYDTHGSMTMALEELLTTHSSIKPHPTQPVRDLYITLENIAELSGNAQKEAIAEAFETYHQPLVAFGLLSSDYSVGISHKTVGNTVGGDHSRYEIEKARSLKSDSIDLIKYAQDDSNPFPPQLTVTDPFLPMKAKDKEAPEGDTDYVAQLKVDGYRILLHVSDGDVTAFTRNMKDVTGSMPELSDITWPDGEYIFDTEAVAYDGNERLGYTATSERIGRKHDIDEFDTTIHFKVFDCVYANEDISAKELQERFEITKQHLPEHELLEFLAPMSDLTEALHIAEEEQYEGIICKDLTKPYEFDKRSTHWRKAKLTDETVDLICAGIESGTGKNANTLGHIRLETRDGTFVGNCGTGFTEAEEDEIWNNSEQYIGEVVEIGFEGFDEKLRFPKFLHFRPDGEADTYKRLTEEIAESY